MISWLFSTHTRHQRVKTLLLVLCIVGFFAVPVFAAGAGTETSSSLLTLQGRLHKLLSIFSRLWIVLAILAGKLMTNERVYGSFMHLDIYLWKIWNIIKNFSNFALMGLLLWEIIKGITGKEKLDAKKVITKTLIAGILIQASWFLMGAILDVSSVAMSAVSAFPSNFFGSDSQLTQQVAKDVSASMYNKNYLVKFSDPSSPQDIQNVITSIPSEQSAPALSDDAAVQTVLPTSSSVSGPLIFLGMSAFRFQDYMDNGGNASVEAVTIGFLLKAVVILMYTIGLALLFVANLIRIAFLWIFIILSPVLIIIKVFFKDSAGGGALKNFSIQSLLWLVFKPVLFVLSLSFALIVIVSFQNIMTDIDGRQLNGVQLTHTNTSSSLQIEGLSSLEISNNSLFKKTTEGAQNTFADLIIFLLSIFLVWNLIKWSLTAGEGPGTEFMKKMTGFIENTSKSLPIFGGFSANQVGTMREESKKKLLSPMGMKADGTFQDNKEAFESKINTLMGIYDPWQASDLSKLNGITNNGGDFFAEARNIGKKRQEGLSLSNSQFKTALEKRLKKPGNAKRVFGNDYTDFEQFFKTGGSLDTTKHRRILHELMGGSENEKDKRPYSDTTPPDYDTLLSHHYFQPTGKRTNE